MTDGDSRLSRRQWRELHQPVVRYNRRIFTLRGSLVVPLSIATFAASTGLSRGGGVVEPEVSAWVVGAVCALTLVALTVDAVRRNVTAGGAALTAATAALSAVVVLGRAQSALSTSIVAMLAVNAVGVLVGTFFAVRAVRKRPADTAED